MFSTDRYNDLFLRIKLLKNRRDPFCGPTVWQHTMMPAIKTCDHIFRSHQQNYLVLALSKYVKAFKDPLKPSYKPSGDRGPQFENYCIKSMEHQIYLFDHYGVFLFAPTPPKSLTQPSVWLLWIFHV